MHDGGMIERAWEDIYVNNEYDMAKVAAISLCEKARDRRLVIASKARDIVVHEKGYRLSLSRVRRLAQLGIIYSLHKERKTKHRYGYCMRSVLHIDPRELEWYLQVGKDDSLNQIEKRAKRNRGWHPEIFGVKEEEEFDYVMY